MFLTKYIDILDQVEVMELNLATEQYGLMKGRQLLENNLGYPLNDDEIEWEEFHIDGQRGLLIIHDDVNIHWFHRPITNDDVEIINKQLIERLEAHYKR